MVGVSRSPPSVTMPGAAHHEARDQDVAAGGRGRVAPRVHHQHLPGRAGLDCLALRMPAALEGAELVEVLARRDVAQRVGLTDHPRRLWIQQKYTLNKNIP